MSVREALVNAQGTELRMLAVVPPDRRAEIARQLAALKPDILFLERLNIHCSSYYFSILPLTKEILKLATYILLKTHSY